MSIRALRRIQFGFETTKGTAVAATNYWRGTGVMEDRREVVFPDEDIGILMGDTRNYTQSLLAAMTWDETPATFELLPYILNCAVSEDTAGTQDGTEGSGYVYTFTVATNAAPTTKTLTIEGGDDQQAEEMEYAFVESFRLSGSAGEALTVSADWLGRQVSTCTFTTNATLDTVEEIIFSKGTLYIDDIDGTAGNTEISSTLMGLDLTFNTGLVARRHANGELYFATTVMSEPEITMDLTFEHNSSARTEITNWRSNTPRLVTLTFQGDALSTAGDEYTYKTLTLNLAGAWESFEKLDEIDGNDVVTGRFRARYDVDNAAGNSIIVVNEDSTLGD